MPITLTSFTIKESRDERGYIFYDLRATLSDGRKILSMSHDARLDALKALGEALVKANDRSSSMNVRLKRVANIADGIKSVRTEPMVSPEVNRPIAPPNKPPYNPQAVRLVKTKHQAEE